MSGMEEAGHDLHIPPDVVNKGVKKTTTKNVCSYLSILLTFSGGIRVK